MAGCRIGKVKMKGGADVLRFPKPSRDGIQQHVVDTAVHYANTYAPGELHGFILIAWSAETTISVARVDDAAKIGISMLPAFAQEETRRALVRQGSY